MRYASITDRLTGLGSGKWAVHIEARNKIQSGVPVIELTIGEPDIAPDRRLLDECARAMYAGRTRYSNGRGEAAVVAALVEKYKKRRSDVTSDNVLCFPGTQTALFAVMLGLVEAGDTVLTGDPLYATYEGVVASTGATLATVPLHPEKRFHLQAADLETAITPTTRVLLLNNPHNPSGAVLSADEVAAIGAVCRKHDLWIVCDEVYEQLIFEKTFFSPFDDPDLAERVIAVSSISKSHAAPGFRSGWAVGPAEFCARLLPVSETMLFGVQPFIADMTAMALSQDFDTARIMKANYVRRANIVATELKSSNAIRPLMPEGGMFILLDVSGTGLSGEDFAWSLLRNKQVAVMPGSSFGAEAKDFVRLSLTVNDDDLKIAVDRIAELGEELLPAAARQAS
jgi:arginine:pyruvate transaminase